jgi:predicted aspartyl protease
MILGYVRDRFPRITLNIPTQTGPVSVEFVLDTAFDGDLALPHHLAVLADMTSIGFRDVRLADGSESRRQYYRMLLPWDEATVPVEVLVLENNPLVGVGLMEDYLLQAEMRTGGEVSLEPL